MSLTRAFRTAHYANPTLGYKELATYLHCEVQKLRGINSRLHLPIPVRPKAAKGESKRLKGIREAYATKTILMRTKEPAPKAWKAKKAKPMPTVLQTGSGRKQYGGYLKLL